MATPVYNNAGQTGVADGGASTVTLASFAANSGSNRFLEVWAGSGDGTPQACTGVTWGGQTLTQRGNTQSGTYWRHNKWYLKEADFPGGATGDIVATYAGNVAERAICAIVHSDVDQSSPYRNASQTEEVDTVTNTPSVGVTSNADDVVTAGVYAGQTASGITAIATTAGTERCDTGPLAGGYEIASASTVAGAGTATITWSISNGTTSDWNAILADSLQGQAAEGVVNPTVGTLRIVPQTPTARLELAADTPTEHLRTGTTSPQTFSHTNASASRVRGVLLALMHGTSATDHVSAASYGGVAMSRVNRTTDTGGEPGAAEWWFVGTGLSGVQGTQVVSYTPGSTTDDIHAVVITLTADYDLVVLDSDQVSADSSGGTLDDPSRTLQYGSRLGLSFGALYSGQTAYTSTTAGTGCTAISTSELAGNFSSRVIRQTEPGTSDFTITAVTAGADDAAYVAVTIGLAMHAKPGTAALVFVGQQPTVSQAGGSASVDPSVGVFRFVGQQPTVGVTYSAAPQTGVLQFVGQQPTISQAGDHVVTPTVGVLRFVGNTPTVGQSGGAITALVFPSNGGSAAAFRWAGTFPDIVPLTVIWRHYPVQQTGYYCTFFHSRTDGDFLATRTYFGCHPYPQGGASGTVHNWEISCQGGDDIVDENSNSTVVTKEQWYAQAASSRHISGSESTVEFYWDLATDSGRWISYTTTDGQLSNDTNQPGLTFGFSPWSPTENLSGRLRGIQVYSSQLSLADIQALYVCESDAEVIAVCGQRGISSLWYCNVNPTPSDITDKSGAGHDPSWVNANRPTLWTAVQPTAGTLRFVGQQPTLTLSGNVTVAPSVGALQFVGQQPTVSVTAHQTVAPSVGSLLFVGQQPTVSRTEHQTVAPVVGTLQFAGQQPALAVTAHQWTSPSEGVFRFVGQVPAVGFTHSAAPTVGTLRFTGQQPTVTVTAGQAVYPSVGTLRFDGLAPVVGFTHSNAPTVGVLRFAGQQPTVQVSASGTVQPFTGTLRFDGQAPTVGFTHRVAPVVGAVQFVGQQPAVSVGANQSVAPTVGLLRVVGQQPTTAISDHRIAAPQVGTLRFAGNAPTLSETQHQTVAPSAGTVRVTGNVPVLSQTAHVWVVPSAGTLRIVGNTPLIGKIIGHASRVVDAGPHGRIVTGHRGERAITTTRQRVIDS